LLRNRASEIQFPGEANTVFFVANLWRLAAASLLVGGPSPAKSCPGHDHARRARARGEAAASIGKHSIRWRSGLYGSRGRPAVLLGPPTLQSTRCRSSFSAPASRGRDWADSGLRHPWFFSVTRTAANVWQRCSIRRSRCCHHGARPVVDSKELSLRFQPGLIQGSAVLSDSFFRIHNSDVRHGGSSGAGADRGHVCHNIDAARSASLRRPGCRSRGQPQSVLRTGDAGEMRIAARRVQVRAQ